VWPPVTDEGAEVCDDAAQLWEELEEQGGGEGGGGELAEFYSKRTNAHFTPINELATQMLMLWPGPVFNHTLVFNAEVSGNPEDEQEGSDSPETPEAHV